MRKLLLLTPLLLAGCVDDSATYYIDGNQHALTVRVLQEYFWKKDVTIDLLASRMPDCQRRIPLGALPMSDVEIELFQSGENVYTLRAGEQAWRVETAGLQRAGSAGTGHGPAARPVPPRREQEARVREGRAGNAEKITTASSQPRAMGVASTRR